MREKMEKKTKIIAFYLPQFHEIIENNMWWGKGYTEWTSVKAAKPLFKGHKQPNVPYKSCYYNLLDKNIMIWQAKNSLKAGIDGFCFYHYWFKGRKILEKPIENYLKWKEIPQQFCFSWANDSWIRSWSNVQGTIWNSKREKKTCMKGSDVGILIKQDYGDESVWKEHFEYLVDFFLDQRYIKIDNKPLFLIYKPDEVEHLEEMICFWNMLACEYGFNGMHVLVTNPLKHYHAPICGCVNYEPGKTIDYKPLKRRICEFLHINDEKKLLCKYSYSKLWLKILRRKPDKNMKTYLGAFIDYDDSPRRGYQSYIVRGATPFKFQIYLRLLLRKCKSSNQYGDYIFITAWNEWAEGAYLEPDDKNKYKYLKAIKKVISTV